MLTIIKADGSAERRQLDAMRSRAAQKNADIELTVQTVMENVRQQGFSAVERYSRQFDHEVPYEIPKDALEAAAKRVPAELLAALQRSADHIRAYQSRLRDEIQFGEVSWDSPVGGKVGRIVRPLRRVGVYVPGGRAAYPSSVLMNVLPAKAAGVDEVVMVTPPTNYLNDAVLAAAWVSGVDRAIAVGGVQAVAALTYGAGFIPRVDKLVGPGNAYVAAAKRLAYGILDIDMVAGPSEVLVIADGGANPKYVAADLLSQAEHDPLASAVLLTTSLELAEAVDQEMIRQTGYLSRSEITAVPLCVERWRSVPDWRMKLRRNTWKSSQRTQERSCLSCITPGPFSWEPIRLNLWEITWRVRTMCCPHPGQPGSSHRCLWTHLLKKPVFWSLDGRICSRSRMKLSRWPSRRN